MAYEKEQRRLEKLLQEMLSDDENSLFGDVYLSDEFSMENAESCVSDSDSSSGNLIKPKRKKVRAFRASIIEDISLPSTSRASTSKDCVSSNRVSTDTVSLTIEDVTSQFQLNANTSSGEEDSLHEEDSPNELRWELVHADEVKTRWRTLRERFVKEDKLHEGNTSSGQSQEDMLLKWKWYDSMAFLRVHIKPRKTWESSVAARTERGRRNKNQCSTNYRRTRL
ncbi:Alcohol dehydrogenase transcription factor Myb/SANT-like [Popillia japonica]|uniref:Alcohol dehydrogenase transcription factor Myb/SANT-like n=1 Tax=Popillia japonica TaxID=7064 RepID=A0AAW1HRX5_POPJA